MKLLYILSSGNPGGAEIQAVNLLREMRQRGVDAKLGIYYGFGSQPGNIRPLVERHDIPCVDFGPMANREYALKGWIEGEAPDMVIGAGYPVDMIAVIQAQRAGVPIRVLRLENCGFTRQEFPQGEDFETAGMQAATHTIGNSSAVVDSIQQYPGGDKGKASVIPNGVSIPDLTPGLRERARAYWQLDDHQVAIGLLANFRPDGIKNQAMLVRVAAHLVERHPNLRFIMAGYHSSYTDTVQAEINRYGLNGYVTMPGRLDDVDMIAGWDMAVNCSRTEGLSNAVMECLVYGLPMVITAVDGNIEFADTSGVSLAPFDDHLAMTAALNSIIMDLAFEKHRSALIARRGITRLYSWDTIIPQWLNLTSP